MHHFERGISPVDFKVVKIHYVNWNTLATPMNTGCLVIPCMKDNITIALIVKRI